MQREYYSVLGVSTNANDAEIISAYRKMSAKFHPDANNGDPFFEERYREIQKAYSVLINPIRRSAYDSELDTHFFQEQPKLKDTESPIITVFDISKKNIEESEPVTIRWQTVHADDVFINCLGKVEPEGVKTLRIPELISNPNALIIITAVNSFTSEKAVKEIELKNKSYKEKEKLAALENDQSRNIIKEPSKTEKKELEPEIKREPKKIEKTRIIEEKVVIEKPKKTRKLSKEEILSGVNPEIEADSEKKSFGLKDVYVYIVLLVLLVVIVFMAIIAYNMNPIT